MSYKYLFHKKTRTIVVGDIHGCYQELRTLLEKINFTEADLLISVGDMVDRGPGTWDVAYFFKETPNAYSVMGNHERRLAGTIKGTYKPAWTQLHSLSKINSDEYEVWRAYFDSLPAVIETPDVIVTHARLDPSKSIDSQDPYYTCAVGGYAVRIEKDKNDVPLWYEEWTKINGNTKPICIGHIGYENVELVENQLYALDTGAAKGGELTAVIFPDRKIVQVKSGINHYNISHKEWLTIKSANEPPEEILIFKYIEVKNRNMLSNLDMEFINAFEEHLISLQISKKLRIIRAKIEKKYGKMPDSGIERGEYVKILKKNYPKIHSRIILESLSYKPFDISVFLQHFKDVDLKTILDALNSLTMNQTKYIIEKLKSGESFNSGWTAIR